MTMEGADRHTVYVRRVRIDVRRNTLTLDLHENGEPSERSIVEGEGVLDIGMRGRLIGLEIEGIYAAVTDPDRPADELARSATIPVSLIAGESGAVSAIEFARHGPDYEITFPSGNECWRQSGADVETCAEVQPAAE